MAPNGSVEAGRSRSVRRRAFMAMSVAIVGGFVLSVIGIAVPEYHALLVVGLVIALACAGYTFTLSCPRCGTPIFKRKVTIDGIDVTYWGGFTVPRNCSECGLDLP
jgi:hypothetical protein